MRALTRLDLSNSIFILLKVNLDVLMVPEPESTSLQVMVSMVALKRLLYISKVVAGAVVATTTPYWKVVMIDQAPILVPLRTTH